MTPTTVRVQSRVEGGCRKLVSSDDNVSPLRQARDTWV
jgi:hypothetical protein